MYKQLNKNLLMLSIIVLTAICSVWAAEKVKIFEFGPGTPHARKHFRTFFIPCGQDFGVKVRFHREGPAGASNDVPVFADIRRPGTTSAPEGGSEDFRTFVAQREPSEKSFRTDYSIANRDCTIPWRIRLGYNAPGFPRFAVKGEITVTTVNVLEGPIGDKFTLNKNDSTTIGLPNISGVQGICEGRLIITGSWKHSFLGFDGFADVNLVFSLKDPDGRWFTSATGHSNTVRLERDFGTCLPGQWMLEIQNNTGNDVKDIDLKLTLIPRCT